MKKKTDIIKSYGYSQTEIIKNILILHNNNEKIDVDCTYSKGIFYKDGKVSPPKYKYDLSPQTKDTIRADSRHLPLEKGSIKCMIFDPPFIISGKTYKSNKEGSSIIAKRFAANSNFKELKEYYYSTLQEAHRVLQDNGILIVKCQNTISSGKQHFSHFFLIKSAIELGFYPKDEFILLNKSKITSFGGRWKKQRHAMKHHSFFLVLEKRVCRVNYEVEQ